MLTNRIAAAQLADLRAPSAAALDLEDGGTAVLTQTDYRGRTYLFKRYHDEYRETARPLELDRMLRWRAGLERDDRIRLDAVAAWPRYTVWDGDTFLGVLTPRAPGVFVTERRPRTLDRLAMVMSDGAGPTLDRDPELIKLNALGHLVAAVTQLHDLGIVVNDLYAHNVLVSAFGDAVLLVDCDSMAGEHWRPVLPTNVAPERIRSVIPGVDRPSRATDFARLALVVITTLLDPDLEQIGPDRLAVLAGLLRDADDAAFVCQALQTTRWDAAAAARWRGLGAKWQAATVIATAPTPGISPPLQPHDPIGGPLLPTGPSLPRLDWQELSRFGLKAGLDLTGPAGVRPVRTKQATAKVVAGATWSPPTPASRVLTVRVVVLVMALIAGPGAAVLWWVAG